MPVELSASRLAQLAVGVGTCLLVLFVSMVIGSFLPAKLLDPSWQLQFAGTLVAGGSLPLVGLFVIVFAAYLDPEDAILLKRQAMLRSLACWVAVAYLLLIPLQLMSCSMGLDRAGNLLNRNTRKAEQTIEILRAAIKASPDFPTLKSRLRQLKLVSLPPEAASVPIATLRASMLERLQVTDNRLRANLQKPLIGRFWPILRDSLRNMMGAFVLALGFASIALPKGGDISLLQVWMTVLSGLAHQPRRLLLNFSDWFQDFQSSRDHSARLRRIRRAHQSAKRVCSDLDYIDEIIKDRGPSDRRGKDGK